MKRFFILMILALVPSVVSAQSDMDDFFAGYSGQQGFQTIIYGKRMLNMMKEDASSDVRALLNRISTIRIISHEEPLNGIIYSARRSVNQSQQYEIISQINENGSLSEFYITENLGNSKNVSFLMIISSPQGSAVMEIVGEFDVKDISRLAVIGQKK